MPTPPAGSSSWGLAAGDPEPLWYAARASAPDSGPPTPAEASRSGAGALRPAEAITGCRCSGTLVGLGPEMRRYASAGDGVSPQLLYLPWEFLRRRPRCGLEGRIFESCWARQDFAKRLGGLATGAFPLWVPRHGLHSQAAPDLLVPGVRVWRGRARALSGRWVLLPQRCPSEETMGVRASCWVARWWPSTVLIRCALAMSVAA